MNAATRAIVRYCLRQGHVPLTIHNGFKGLLDDATHEPSWLGVDNWAAKGGSELGTNRTLPDVDLGAVAAKLQALGADALIMIGGFEALSALRILADARKTYPALRVPLVHLPATISNNVPLTEFSLGADTSVNALVDACDAIKQSASASRNRVFVVETQGGRCGYIATMGALATGAAMVYTPEQGISLHMLRDDVKFLKRRFALDEKGRSEGRLVIKCGWHPSTVSTPVLTPTRRSEGASSVYTLDMLTKMFKEEGGTLFDSRSANLGHTLQGNIPTPLDRARAVRLALRCMSFCEEHHAALRAQPARTRTAGPDSAATITVQGTTLRWVPVDEMIAHADVKQRRGKETWWQKHKDLVETLVARPQII
jgi:6-phosphofructokinase 1